ncbi:MAG: hypothetical protein ACI8TP_001910 [Acidimicrobiales bacterium]|jgi:hypothetical protein
MGAQDNFSFAQEFRESTGTTSFPMLWDEAFSTWSYYGVSGQPTAILVDVNGLPIKSWLGSFSTDEVLELAEAA